MVRTTIVRECSEETVRNVKIALNNLREGSKDDTLCFNPEEHKDDWVNLEDDKVCSICLAELLRISGVFKYK